MKKWIISAVILVTITSVLLIVKPGETRLKSYYSGDAISYQNNLYVATTNTGSLEVFKLNDKKLDLIGKMRPYNHLFSKYDDFFDTKLSVENNRLFVYVVSNYTLYKYEITDTSLVLVNDSKNNFWEWYNRVDKFGDNIVTISAKGINVFNKDLEIIVSHKFTNKNAPYNVSSTNDRFILNVNEEASRLEVYDIEKREVITHIPLNFKHDKGNRRAYQDSAGYIYVVDDYYTKKFDLSGKLLGSFRHLDYQGFDVSGTAHAHNIYFSNGVGVVKLNKQMEAVDWAWTNNLGSQGGWAMGLKAVYNNGDKVVVFNNTNILVLDENLDRLAVTLAIEEAEATPVENLYLNIDKPRATVNSSIALSGGGYLPYEHLEITFGDTTVNTSANESGRFSSLLTVPHLSKGYHDIRVEGQNSKLHYSISFLVE